MIGELPVAEIFDATVPPGGYVCAEEPADARTGVTVSGRDVCGWPTESEPCPDHGEPQRSSS